MKRTACRGRSAHQLGIQSDPTIIARYIPQLRPEAANALNALNRHFGQGSALTAIRNRISFHYRDKDNLTEASFQQLAPTEPLQFYLSKTVGNSFYHAGELVAQLTAINMMKAPPAGPNDSRSAEARAFNALCTEIIEVSHDVTELFGSLIGMLSENAVSTVTTKQIPNGPKLSLFLLPYFFDENDSLPVE